MGSRVPPRVAHFFFEKSVVLGVVELFALELCYLSPHDDSCIILSMEFGCLGG